MKKKIVAVFIVLFVLLFLAACGKKELTNGENADADTIDQIYCTADVQECPDGSFVARDPKNNCEFKVCQKN